MRNRGELKGEGHHSIQRLWPTDEMHSFLLHCIISSGGRSVGIVRSRTKATELVSCVISSMGLRGITNISHKSFDFTKKTAGARGSVVVKALCYKPEGRGFDTQ
jgi:hypothetical protein